MIPFIKMQSLGNDFVLLDQREDPNLGLLSDDFIQRLADRRLGVGCDQVLVLVPSKNPKAVCGVVIYNQDGSVAQTCGNGLKCIGLYLLDESDEPYMHVQVVNRLVKLSWVGDDIQVDMGESFINESNLTFDAYPQLGAGTVVDMGNLHVVFFTQLTQSDSLSDMAMHIQSYARFPDGVNVGFCTLSTENDLHLMVWERGAGFTGACGSGACAAAKAALKADHIKKETVDVYQLGGRSTINWSECDNILLSGPAHWVYDGVYTYGD
jgi:diaminopimelate epimerase